MPPVVSERPDMPVIGVFLASIFIAIASGTALVLYSPHLILRRKLHQGRTKDFLWKPVFATSLRRGLIVSLIIVGILLLNLFGQGGLVNTVLILLIFLLLEIYFSRMI
jgi:hypothetical protein